MIYMKSIFEAIETKKDIKVGNSKFVLRHD